MNKRKKREKNGTEKKKRNRDNRKQYERQTKSIKKTRRKKKEKEKEVKTENGNLKSVKMEHTTMEKKGSFCSKRETNKRTERKRERETLLGSVRVWAHFERCCVAVTSHPQPPLRRGHGCIVGVNQDPPV